ncbi:MAG: hypothetical protein R3D67_13825 [Hyphomicrobiaceae bacterium]
MLLEIVLAGFHGGIEGACVFLQRALDIARALLQRPVKALARAFQDLAHLVGALAKGVVETAGEAVEHGLHGIGVAGQAVFDRFGLPAQRVFDAAHAT